MVRRWLAEKYFCRYKELDFLSKQKFKTQNPIDWNETKCVICNFHLLTVTSNFPSEKITTYLDFVIATEHAFIRNIFDLDELKLSKSIQTHKKYHDGFQRILQIVVLLNTNYSDESDIEDISDDCIIKFVNEINFDSFTDLYLEIENTQVKNLKWEDRRETKIYKLTTFV